MHRLLLHYAFWIFASIVAAVDHRQRGNVSDPLVSDIVRRTNTFHFGLLRSERQASVAPASAEISSVAFSSTNGGPALARTSSPVKAHRTIEERDGQPLRIYMNQSIDLTHFDVKTLRSTLGDVADVNETWVPPSQIVRTIISSSVRDGAHTPDLIMRLSDDVYWEANETPAFLIFEFLQSTLIGGVRVVQPAHLAGGEFRAFKLKFSDTGENWNPIGYGTGLRHTRLDDVQSIDFYPRNTKYLKLLMLSTWSEEHDPTLAYIEFKVVKGNVSAQSFAPRMALCSFEGKYDEQYRCRSQKHAQERCSDFGLRLCMAQELEEQLGRGCNFMYTQTSAKLGYRVGTGGLACGVEGQLGVANSSFNGRGYFNAACCDTTTSTTMPIIFQESEVHEAHGLFYLIGAGGCASTAVLEPESSRVSQAPTMEACRRLCDSDEGCGALSYCASRSICYLYSNTVVYNKTNGHEGQVCWGRKDKIKLDKFSSQVSISWQHPKEIVKVVKVTSQALSHSVDDLLEDNEMYWEAEQVPVTISFEMIGVQMIGGISLMKPCGRKSGVRDGEVEYSLDSVHWSVAKKFKRLPNLPCATPSVVEWKQTQAPFWRVRFDATQPSIDDPLALRYIEFKAESGMTRCGAFLPGLHLLPASTKSFVGMAEYGGVGIPFGSGSLAGGCRNTGPGIGPQLGMVGKHCWVNINDGIEGEKSSWMPGRKFRDSHFVGINFGAVKSIRGFRISTPWLNKSSIGGWYHAQYSGLYDADHMTPDANWCTIDSFTRNGTGYLHMMFSQPVNASALRLVVTDFNVMIDEFLVFGDADVLPITAGLAADFRSAVYSRGSRPSIGLANIWQNHVSTGSSIQVPDGVNFDHHERAFVFKRGNNVMSLNLKTDPVAMPECTYIAWAKFTEQSLSRPCNAALTSSNDTDASVLVLKVRLDNFDVQLLDNNTRQGIVKHIKVLAQFVVNVTGGDNRVVVTPLRRALLVSIEIPLRHKLDKFYTMMQREAAGIADELARLLRPALSQTMIDAIGPPEGRVHDVLRLPACAFADVGRGWIMAQVPDFGRSRGLVLHDWRGAVSMMVGSPWNSSFGRAPVDKWFLVAGVYMQSGESFGYFDGKASATTTLASNTAAGTDVNFILAASKRCVSSKEKYPNKLVFSTRCSAGESRLALNWVDLNSSGYPGTWSIRHSLGTCFSICRNKSCGREASDPVLVVLARCDPRDPQSHFTKVVIREGVFRVMPSRQNLTTPMCVGISTHYKLGLVLCNDTIATEMLQRSMADVETLSIGGKYSKDFTHNPSIMISDVIVYNRALSVNELNKLYRFGRPSAPSRWGGSFCPHPQDTSSKLCRRRIGLSRCDYLVHAAEPMTCQQHCAAHHLLCIGVFFDSEESPVTCDIVNNYSQNCSQAHREHLCRCRA